MELSTESQDGRQFGSKSGPAAAEPADVLRVRRSEMRFTSPSQKANDPELRNDEETPYERRQHFNFLVSWLHSFRYKNIVPLIRAAEERTQGRCLRIVEIGCAHAKLFATIDARFQVDYTGIEINPDFVDTARARYGNHHNFRVVHDSAVNASDLLSEADIVIALEVFEHVMEHEVVRIVETVARARPRLFVCSVPVEIGPAIWLKNLGSLVSGYSRHREYEWRETLWAGLFQLDKLPPHGTGHKGFDWRWLAQTIRHNMQIREIRRFPLGVLPAAVSTSVFIVATPRD